MMVQRRAQRVRFKSPIQAGFVAGDERFSGSLADFSPFGLSVRCPHDVKPGTIFRLGIKVDTDFFRSRGEDMVHCQTVVEKQDRRRKTKDEPEYFGVTADGLIELMVKQFEAVAPKTQ